MNELEDRLRDMYRAATETIRAEDVPGLYEQRRSRPGGRFTVFAPLAAAAAVVLAVALAVTVPSLVRSAAPPSTPTSHRSVTAGVPPYMVVFDESEMRGPFGGPVVVISAKTGRIISHVPAPTKGGSWFSAVPTGNPGMFLLAATPDHLETCGDTYLYTLTLSATGKPAALTPWTDPVVHGDIYPYAASADGGTIAFGAYSCGQSRDQVIGIIRGRTMKTWRVSLPYDAESLSLTADGSELSYVQTSQQAGHSTPQVRLLDTNAPSGMAAAASRVVYTYPDRNAVPPLAVISPGGTMLYVAAAWGADPVHLKGMLAGYRIGGGKLFDWKLTGLRTAQSLDWAGSKLVSMVLDGRYIIDPMTGKATKYSALPLDLYKIVW